MTSTTTTAPAAQHSATINLLKVLGPAHVWALGVGIVLVGEFMGWNYAVGKGGALGALVACFVIGVLYTCVAKIDSEVTAITQGPSVTQFELKPQAGVKRPLPQ